MGSATAETSFWTARAPLVAWMDADDVALPDRLATQVEFLGANPDVVCVGAGIFLIDAKGRRIAPFIRPPHDAEIQDAAMRGVLLLPQPCSMIRRSALDRVGRYDPALEVAEDLDLFLRLGEVGRLANVPRVLLQYRVHDRAISSRASEREVAFVRVVCERAWKRRGTTRSLEHLEPGRAGTGRSSRHAFTMKYGWWAFNAGERSTACIYALKAIGTRPLDRRGWHLLACALLVRVARSSPGALS